MEYGTDLGAFTRLEVSLQDSHSYHTPVELKLSLPAPDYKTPAFPSLLSPDLRMMLTNGLTRDHALLST